MGTPIFAERSRAAVSAPRRAERNTGLVELLAIMAIRIGFCAECAGSGAEGAGGGAWLAGWWHPLTSAVNPIAPIAPIAPTAPMTRTARTTPTNRAFLIFPPPPIFAPQTWRSLDRERPRRRWHIR